jgi:hypothetical protein
MRPATHIPRELSKIAIMPMIVKMLNSIIMEKF